jgi:tetratricopeptide (TPR) repeat protein
VRKDLMTLSKDNAEVVARHLVMAGRLLESAPELAHAHAAAAAQRAGRIGVVREAAGLAAYAVGRHDEALRELRTARRLTGSVEHLPVMADAERGLGRPDRALALAASPEVAQLDPQGQAEMRIVASGARLDLGQVDAAVVALQGPELTAARPEPWHARTYSAYADALRAAGREQEAQAWARRARAVDPDRVSGAHPPAADDTDAEDEVVVYDVAEEPGDGADGADGDPGAAGR